MLDTKSSRKSGQILAGLFEGFEKKIEFRLCPVSGQNPVGFWRVTVDHQL